MAVKDSDSLDSLYQEEFEIDFDDFRRDITELKGLTDQEISSRFTNEGFNLPQKGFVIKLPRMTLRDKIAEFHSRAVNTAERFGELFEAEDVKDGAVFSSLVASKKDPEPEVGNFVAMAEYREKEKFLREINKPEIGNFKNWAQTLNFDVRYKYPTNEDELRQILEKSAKNVDEKIGIVGSGHSWENIFTPPNEILINMNSFYPFNPGQKVQTQPEHRLKIAAGCSIMKKHAELGWEKDDYVLPSNVIYTDVHYVGVVSGGCHGCHFKEGSIPDRVENIVLYTAEGKRVQIPKEEIHVAAIGFGTLGVISEIELRMVPERRVVVESYMWTMQEMMEALKNNYKKWISYEVYWVPFGGITLCQALWCAATGNLSQDYSTNDQYLCQVVREHEEKDGHTDSDLITVVLRDIWKTVLPEIQKSQAKLQPDFRNSTPLLQYIIQRILNRLVATLQSFAPIVTSVYNSIHYLPLVEYLPLQAHDIELCFRCGKGGGDFENIQKSFESLEKEVRYRAVSKKEFPVNLIVEGRICASSKCPLSPSYATEADRHFFYFECLSFPNTIGWEEFSDSFFKAMMEIDGTVKPHLAKEWKCIKEIVPHLKKVAGEGIEKLKNLQKIYDPHGKFMSPALEPLFKDL